MKSQIVAYTTEIPFLRLASCTVLVLSSRSILPRFSYLPRCVSDRPGYARSLDAPQYNPGLCSIPASIRSQNPRTGITLSTLVVALSIAIICELCSTDARTYWLGLTCARDKDYVENKRYGACSTDNERWERREHRDTGTV